MSRTNLIIATFVLGSALFVSCAGKVSATDAQITSDIQSKLYADAATKQTSIGVAVRNGAVTLTGDVPSADVELAAMKIANSTNGVHGVTDQLKVAGTVAATQTAPPLTGNAPSQLAESRRPAPQTSSPAQPSSAPAPAPTDTQPAPATATATDPQPAPSSQPTAVQPVPVAKPIEPERVTIPAGDRLAIRTVDAIDSGKVTEGQALRASLEAPLVSQGRVIVPAGAPVTLQVTNVEAAKRIKGNSALSLRATSIEYRGRNYPIRTSEYSDEGKARGKNTALKTGIGAGVGALIGGLAGGGKGAAIGAGAGGGAGFGFNALTHGQQVKIPSETVLNFRLEAPLSVPAPR